MGALGILSIFAVYILIERYSTIKKASQEDESFLKSIQNFVEARGYRSGIIYLNFCITITQYIEYNRANKVSLTHTKIS